jgi:integrase
LCPGGAPDKTKASSFLSAAPEQSKPKLLDQVRRLMGMRHYSLRTLATHLLENGYNTLTVQELLGHKDVSATMIYTCSTGRVLASRVRWIKEQTKSWSRRSGFEGLKRELARH